MIIRERVTDELVMIGQTEHARLVGQLAAHWGNADFMQPDPYESVVRAAIYHDHGWLRYETNPLMNPETGEPYDFMGLPLTDKQLDAYQWALDWLTDIDRYTGLLVNIHRTGLWKARYQTIKYPEAYTLPKMGEKVNAFIARNEARQERERSAVAEYPNLWTNYRLLEVWDLLGLYFCATEPYDHYIEPVPVRYGARDDHGVRITLTPVNPRQVKFEPYPFDIKPLRVQLGFKRLPKTKFSDLAEFRRAYYQAEPMLMSFELV